MSGLDPYTDVARWLDMDARAESMLRHPAGQARMDAEACALANSGSRESRLPEWVGGLLLGLFVYFVLAGIGVAGAVVGGWPL